MELQKRDKKGRFLPTGKAKNHVIRVTSEEKELIQRLRKETEGD